MTDKSRKQPTFVQIGAGRVGRALFAGILSRAGYEVVFVEVDRHLVDALNEARAYTVSILDEEPQDLRIQGIRAIAASDIENVLDALERAEMAATAVGPNFLPNVYAVLARGLERRHVAGRPRLHLLIGENLRRPAETVREGLREHLPEHFPLDETVSLVGTVIGTMHPPLDPSVTEADPLRVARERFDTVYADGEALAGAPDIPGLVPVRHWDAHVDQKLFVHNLGHAAAAYWGYLALKGAHFIHEVMADEALARIVCGAMEESDRALAKRYPGVFGPGELTAHREDLLRRFRNPHLKDTLHRVGHDVPRKMARSDRIIGALLLDARVGVAAPCTTATAAAALFFRAPDEMGRPDAQDVRIARRTAREGPRPTLKEIAGLCEEDPAERTLLDAIEVVYGEIAQRRESPAQVREFLLRVKGKPQIDAD